MSTVEPKKNAVPLPGGSYDFQDLQKALDRAVDTDDASKRSTDVNEALLKEQANEARTGVSVPEGHTIETIEDAQGNKVKAAVAIIEKGEAVDPTPPAHPAGGATDGEKPATKKAAETTKA